MDTKLETALLEVIQKISETFGPKAVLRGGMALRLQGISRSTIDADFSFQSSVHKKKDFGEELVNLITTLSDELIEVNYHSSIVQIIANVNSVKIIIEGSTSSAFEPTIISTAPIASRLKKQPAMISIMPNDMALAHKLAAWLERRLVRDLYDIYVLYDRLESTPDPEVLKARLEKINYLKGVAPRPKLRDSSEFLHFLKEQVKTLDPDVIESQMRGMIDDRELNGIGIHIKNVLLAISF